MEYYSAIKVNEILLFATMWLVLEGIMISEICQTGKDKYYMIALIYGIQKQKQNPHGYKKQIAGCQSWGWGR